MTDELHGGVPTEVFRSGSSVEAEVVRCADLVVASTAEEHDQLVHYYGADPERIEIAAPQRTAGGTVAFTRYRPPSTSFGTSPPPFRSVCGNGCPDALVNDTDQRSADPAPPEDFAEPHAAPTTATTATNPTSRTVRATRPRTDPDIDLDPRARRTNELLVSLRKPTGASPRQRGAPCTCPPRIDDDPSRGRTATTAQNTTTRSRPARLASYMARSARAIRAATSSPGGDRKSTRLNSSHVKRSRMPSSA